MRTENWIGRSTRNDTNVEALVYLSDGTKLRALLTEMSEGGCRIECDAILPIGEAVQIAIPRMGQINAQIRWSLAGSAGARFDNHSPH